MVKRFADWGTTELTAVEILKYWRVEPLVDASVVARFTDLRTSAALLDRPLGNGRVALWTTGLDRTGWNDLAASGWSFLALCDQIVRHVSRGADVSWNHAIGDTVSVPLDTEPIPARVLMRTPNMRQIRLEVPANARTLPVKELTQPGNYRLLGDEPDSPFEAGLSVTIPGVESDLTRVTAEQLTERLGKDRYALATSIEGLRREVRAGRVGRRRSRSWCWCWPSFSRGNTWLRTGFMIGSNVREAARDEWPGRCVERLVAVASSGVRKRVAWVGLLRWTSLTGWTPSAIRLWDVPSDVRQFTTHPS